MGDRRPAVLVTVSGAIPADLDRQVADGQRPRADYRVLAERMDADVVDENLARARLGRVGRLLHRVAGTGPLLAAYVVRYRRDYDVVLTDGEQAGLPLAFATRLFGRGECAHAMIVHILSVPKKERLVKWARLAGRIDRYIVYCERQAEYVRDELGVDADRVVVSTFMVDTAFFSPHDAPARTRALISSAGLERRDYPTLLTAVDGLDVDVVIAAASPWSKQPDSSAGRELPANVTVRRLDLFELRDLFASSSFVVMPLVDVDFQAGITTILEAMAMGLAVVCTRTAGQTDTIVDDETGVYVEPGDPSSLRSAIERLLADPEEARRLGANARRWVVANADVDRYVDALARVVDELASERARVASSAPPSTSG